MSDWSKDLEERNMERIEVVYPWNAFYWREFQKSEDNKESEEE